MKAWMAGVFLMLSGWASAAELTIVSPGGQSETVKTSVLMERFPGETIETANPWSPDRAVYEGIDLQALLEAYELSDQPVRLVAADNYSVVLQPGELEQLKRTVLATTKNGKALSRRDFGPNWLIADFDAHPEIDVERTRNLSIWALVEIAPE